MLYYFRTYWAIAASFIILGAFSAARAWVTKAVPNAEAYHAAIRQAASLAPIKFGNWIGQDVPVPRGAIQTLRPNVMLSRRFTTLRERENFTFLLVHCEDARDLIGHYPPSCYPSQGWEQRASRMADSAVDGLGIEGMEYIFASNRLDAASEVIVYNFMLLPNGSTCRDLNGLRSSAKDFRQRSFGAAQVQVLFDASVPVEKRRELVVTVVRAHRVLIDAILAGGR
jgi:hypothetical protein